MTKWIAGLIVALVAAPAPGEAEVDVHERFSRHWHDGQAELDGYRLTVQRYGEEREGVAVMIFVTEPLRLSTRVKADDPSERPDDVVDVLKLNFVRDFQTGIYDYDTMTSVFSATSDLELLKVSFSSAEWCGHVYSEMVTADDQLELLTHSYFEGESGRQELDRPSGGITGEELFVLLRGLKGDFLAPGEQRTLPFLPSAFVQRLHHRPAEWIRATVRRAEVTTPVSVPAGEFEVSRYEIEIADGRKGSFDIESAWPHRIVRWSLAPDVEGALTGSLRTPYWQENREGDESRLEALGLPVPR